MHRLATAQVARACRIFLDFAYPAGLESIPARVRLYFDLPLDRSATELFAGPPTEVLDLLHDAEGQFKTISLRLGCCTFPHLKLQIHLMNRVPEELWIFAVDTHDHFSRQHYRAPADHPEAKQWHVLQESNQALKEKIESAWREAQLPTFLTVLAEDLEASGATV